MSLTLHARISLFWAITNLVRDISVIFLSDSECRLHEVTRSFWHFLSDHRIELQRVFLWHSFCLSLILASKFDAFETFELRLHLMMVWLVTCIEMWTHKFVLIGFHFDSFVETLWQNYCWRNDVLLAAAWFEGSPASVKPIILLLQNILGIV